MFVLSGCLLAATGQANDAQSLLERGEYLLHAGGCITCHTAEEDDAERLAGGHAFDTEFGTFYSPNITPDVDTGIGAWTDQEFLDALHEGRRPGGGYYFPVFPYTAYTGMTRDDALALKAYLFSLEPVSRENRPHDLKWYIGTGPQAGIWRSLFFEAGRFVPDPAQSAEWNRGAYLVRHLGHCGECHSPRGRLGAVRSDRELAGNPTGPDGKKVPNITPDEEAGIGAWSTDEIVLFLQIGILPDGDFTGGSMSPVIDDNTSLLTEEDQLAIAAYLQSLPALGPENPE